MKSKFRRCRQTATSSRISARKYASIANVSDDENGTNIDRPSYLRLNLPADRSDRLAAIREAFPDAKGPDAVVAGGRAAGLKKLAEINPSEYGRTRNFLTGKVSGLSPYLRHGAITLAECRDQALKCSGAQAAYKFISELAWRDFWRRVWYDKGDAINEPLELPKVPLGDGEMPSDIKDGATGLPCMDGFVGDLIATGYVHNHARMWFAAYCVHVRKLNWRECADFYYSHLLDGDQASNYLSWQWVASTFAAKPYFFNRDNLEKYSAGRYCKSCHAKCPFDKSYAELESTLFEAETA
jgi:deoxyribodipyrimidine photo-lyase